MTLSNKCPLTLGLLENRVSSSARQSVLLVRCGNGVRNDGKGSDSISVIRLSGSRTLNMIG